MERKLFFKDGKYVSIVQTLDANMSDEEARHVAFAAINKHCKEENEPVYYVRMWNNETATMFDFGSHSEFFMLVHMQIVFRFQSLAPLYVKWIHIWWSAKEPTAALCSCRMMSLKTGRISKAVINLLRNAITLLKVLRNIT